ncbi:peptidase M16 [Candidatus Endobugula sertula]|uniref:Peptidase M16 n=1 Tax=Candidatus Endobugula sertula TaxID=62101 RepID=A0A1D2QTU5_9GAMM|nr:peptidase M16 [Candidatus Endobugula sertula]
MQSPSSSQDAHSSFEWLRSQTIGSLDITMSEYRHKVTGAQHIHLGTNNSENVFLVALRTVPENSTGVAHILEHTALCGSEKYPVRDPFFMMIRRSLNTFMNAFTSSDWTAYPFASQNRKDFDNLLDVYLDAVFFSRLDPMDFAQEGHRLDFTEPGNSNSPLIYKGVVYNEMKGAMSSVSSQLWQIMNKYLFPTSTYHHNSGGEPTAITDLSYEQLQQFYHTHYHPSNAIFMTFGDIPAQDHQKKFETLALNRFNKLDKSIQVYPEKRYFSPLRVEEGYAYTPNEDDDFSKKSYIVMAWLLDKNINLTRHLETHLLSNIMYNNSASPMQHLLETSDLGSSPSSLNGIDDSQYEMSFFCGLEGCHVNSADAFEESVIKMLEGIVENGLPQSHIEASLHQLELQQREIGGDGYPYGLQLILNALSPATHRGDIFSFMDLEPALEKLRASIQDRNYIPTLVKQLLLDNPHRVTLTLKPDDQLQQRQQAAETLHLATLKENMSDTEKQHIIDQATALDQRQQQEENLDILPKVSLEDIPKDTPNPIGEVKQLNQHRLHYYPAGTNGLSYQQIICPIPELNAEQLSTLPYYTLYLTEVGIGHQDYLSVQQRQAEVVGNIHAYYSLRSHIDHTDKHHAHITLTAKALSHNQPTMSQLMCDTLQHAHFTDYHRIQELIAQTKASREQSLTNNGHNLAMQAASASLNPLTATIHQLIGLGSIQSIKQLYQQLQDGDFQPLQSSLESIHHQLQPTEKQLLLITDEKSLSEQLQQFETICQPLLQSSTTNGALTLSPPTSERTEQAWIGNSQVHFCAKAYPTVTMNHPDAAPLAVLGGVLRNGFLHRAIREQGGAYGGGASQDSHSASFCFYSYRDPRLGKTLTDFDQSIDWLLQRKLDTEAIEESILGVIGSIDKPSSPAGKAKQHFHAQLAGRTNAIRALFRQRIIEVTAEDLYRVTETYLNPAKANTAVITGSHGINEAEKLGLKLIYL